MNPEPSFLYIEDDEFSRQIINFMITHVLGYSTINFFEDTSNVEERLDQLTPKPDVIFLDIQIEPYDGYLTLEMLRKKTAYRNSKIIAMTANVMATQIQKLKQLGFDGLIGKPVDRKHFPHLVQQILNGDSVWFVA